MTTRASLGLIAFFSIIGWALALSIGWWLIRYLGLAS